MAEEIRRQLDLGAGLEIWKVNGDELREQDLNARAMSNAMFGRLSETIGRDKRMESLPFCALTDKGIEIVSGHHRVRALLASGQKELYVIVDTTGLTESQIKAKQLAHNAIAGVDDPSMLEQIFAGIIDIEDQRESFIDLDLLNIDELLKMDEIGIDFEVKRVLLALIPTYFERWETMVREIPPDVDDVALGDAVLAERFKAALATVGRAYNIKAVSPIICRFIDLAMGLQGEAVDGWVYLTDIFGPRVPEDVGKILQAMLDKMKEKGDITEKNRWQALEYLAAEYLGG